MQRPQPHRFASTVAGALGALALAAGCSPAATPCAPAIVLDPAPAADGRIAVATNAVLAVTASVDQCPGEPRVDYQLRWFYDDNRDGTLAAAERATPIANGPTWQLILCDTPADRGRHVAEVVATPLDAGEPLQATVLLEAASPGGDRSRPACVDTAIASVQAATDITPTYGREPMAAAVQCLEPYLERNLCDFEASMASGLAQFALLGSSIVTYIDTRADMTADDVVAIVDDEVRPLLKRYAVIAAKGPDDFVFRVDGKFQIKLFDNLPYLSGDETVYYLLQGEHDMGDVLAVQGLAEAGQAGLDILLAYRGLAQFFLDLPRFDLVDFDFLRREGVRRLVADETFLTLDPEGMPDGRQRLQRAQAALIDAIAHSSAALAHVALETDPQVDDIVRYWDCGQDGLCDCDDPGEIFLVCPNDEEDSYPGPDEGENNSRYDRGEPVGMERLALTDYFALDLPSDIDEFRRQIGLVAENLRGPEPLDLDELVGLPVETGLELVGVPKPAIRLSEWFVSPSQPRELVPAYSATSLDFLFDIESEPYDDVGYDGLANADETIVHWPNPRGLTVGTEFDALANPDPRFDDLDPLCTPVCTFADGIDNDADGVVDDDDRARIDRFGFTVALPQELGVEGDLMFDFVDLDGDGRHDADEPSEPFDDTGVVDHRGRRSGAQNGHWDFADTQHDYPTGDDVGPVAGLRRRDPANGTANDVFTRLQALGLFGDPTPAMQAGVDYPGLFDPFYFHMPEPTFSGVLTFPEDIQSIDGDFLNENAKLLRFANKLIELSTLVQVAERTADGSAIAPLNLGAHRCADEAACRAAIARVRGEAP